MPTVTQIKALDIREKLEILAGNLEGWCFKDKLSRSTLSSSEVAEYEQMWDWCNKYMHPQPDGKHPNMVATAKAYLEALHYKHKFRPN